MRWPVFLQFGAGLLLSARLWAAAPDPSERFELSYRAAVGCPDEEAFRADLATHVHDASRAGGVRLDLAIERLESGYRGVLVAFDSSGNEGSRRIVGDSCAEVAQALAFLAGIAIELGGRIDEAPQRATAPARPAPLPAAVPPARVAPAIAPSRVDVSAVLLADVRGGFGPSPRPTGEIGFELGARGARWSPSVRLLGFAGTSEFGDRDGSALLRFGGGRLELCPLRLGNASFVARACAGGELAAVVARGQIASEPKRVTKVWAAAEVSLRVQWFATRSFFAELGGGLVLPIVRTQYYFEPDRALYTVPDVSARAALGLGFLFQ
jgi:hypothetical protein